MRHLLIAVALLVGVVPAFAGNVTSKKTGATATVGAQYAAAFQGYINALEEAGATIKFIGGVRKGKCSSYHLHPCGRALDVCQLRRGVVDQRCHLPGKVQMAQIAARYGLFEGGQWCNSDYGHAQVGVTAAACGTQMAAKRHRHHQVAVSIVKPLLDIRKE